jgi:hypothetical protein
MQDVFVQQSPSLFSHTNVFSCTAIRVNRRMSHYRCFCLQPAPSSASPRRPCSVCVRNPHRRFRCWTEGAPTVAFPQTWTFSFFSSAHHCWNGSASLTQPGVVLPNDFYSLNSLFFLYPWTRSFWLVSSTWRARLRRRRTK